MRIRRSVAQFEAEHEETYSIRLPGHMESAALELGEMMEEDSYEGCDVLRRFFRRTLWVRSI